MSRKLRRRGLLRALKVVVSVGLIWLVLAGTDLDALVETASSLPPWVLVASSVLILVQLPIMALRWSLVLRVWGFKLSFPRSVELCYVGLFFNQVLPASVGGDAVRAWDAQREGIPTAYAIKSVLLERLIGLYGFVLVMMLTAPFVWPGLLSNALKLTFVVIGIAAILFVIAVATLDLIIGDRFRNNQLICAILSISADLRSLLSAKMTLANLILLSVISSVSGLLSIHMVAIGLDLGISPWTTVCLASIAVLASVVPLSIAGWGVRESIMVLVFKQVGVDSVSSLTLSLVFGFIMVLTSVPGGLLWARRR